MFSLIDRKLLPDECPHALYIDNYNSASATCISLKKWIFSPTQEKRICSDEQALNLIYYQVGACSTHTHVLDEQALNLIYNQVGALFNTCACIGWTGFQSYLLPGGCIVLHMCMYWMNRLSIISTARWVHVHTICTRTPSWYSRYS